MNIPNQVVTICHGNDQSYQLEDGDGIRLIKRKGRWFNLLCCDCGLKHEVEIKWKNGSTVDLYFKRLEK